jgi:hypothetical protein
MIAPKTGVPTESTTDPTMAVRAPPGRRSVMRATVTKPDGLVMVTCPSGEIATIEFGFARAAGLGVGIGVAAAGAGESGVATGMVGDTGFSTGEGDAHAATMTSTSAGVSLLIELASWSSRPGGSPVNYGHSSIDMLPARGHCRAASPW